MFVVCFAGLMHFALCSSIVGRPPEGLLRGRLMQYALCSLRFVGSALVDGNGGMYTAGSAGDAAVFAVFPSSVGKPAMPSAEWSRQSRKCGVFGAVNGPGC